MAYRPPPSCSIPAHVIQIPLPSCPLPPYFSIYCPIPLLMSSHPPHIWLLILLLFDAGLPYVMPWVLHNKREKREIKIAMSTYNTLHILSHSSPCHPIPLHIFLFLNMSSLPFLYCPIPIPMSSHPFPCCSVTLYDISYPSHYFAPFIRISSHAFPYCSIPLSYPSSHCSLTPLLLMSSPPLPYCPIPPYLQPLFLLSHSSSCHLITLSIVPFPPQAIPSLSLISCSPIVQFFLLSS